jgi:rhamnogalacturonan acetylesterase
MPSPLRFFSSPFAFVRRTLWAAACGCPIAGSIAADLPSDRPTLFILGDSTARNSAKDRRGLQMVGWGTPLADYFDPAKVAVANVAHAGQSSRTYYNLPGDWPSVLPRIKAGDEVLLVFGINDGGPPTTATSRGSVPGLGDDTVALTHADGTVETVHSYGWYMTQMATLAQAKGAQVFLLTVTVRNIWTNPKRQFKDGTPLGPTPADYDPRTDRIERGTLHGKYTAWTEELGRKLHLPVFDLTNFCADRYEATGRETVNHYYSDHNHTYAEGADLVAAAVVSGLKAIPGNPFLAELSAKGQAVAPADPKYVNANFAPAAP